MIQVRNHDVQSHIVTINIIQCTHGHNMSSLLQEYTFFMHKWKTRRVNNYKSSFGDELIQKQKQSNFI
jgi:hypothetical protein